MAVIAAVLAAFSSDGGISERNRLLLMGAEPHNDEPESDFNERTDSSLLRGIRQGDEEATRLLFDRYIDRLHSLANRQIARELSGRVDSEDVTQSIFRTLFRRLQDGQYGVPKGDSIWRLLVTIALNKIRSVGAYHRAAKRDIRRSSDIRAAADHNQKEDESAIRILRLTIEELLEDLSESQRRIVGLRLDGHTVSDIATETQRSKRTVERTLQGFRDKLNGVLCESDPTDESNGT